jgi:hypothetical protein
LKSQERPGQEWLEGVKGRQGVKRVETLKTQRTERVGSPGKKRTLCVGDRCREQNPMRGAERTGHATNALGGGFR